MVYACREECVKEDSQILFYTLVNVLPSQTLN